MKYDLEMMMVNAVVEMSKTFAMQFAFFLGTLSFDTVYHWTYPSSLVNNYPGTIKFPPL